MAYFIATHYNTRQRAGRPTKRMLLDSCASMATAVTCQTERQMQTPPRDPSVSDVAPSEAILTGYDEQHLVTYLRLLDASAEGADWREVARIVLHIDPDREPERARRAWETHLARAEWMTNSGYRHLLRGGAPH